jgi:2'-5' RNA ligase
MTDNDQPSLPGFESGPIRPPSKGFGRRKKHNFFFALLPDEAAAVATIQTALWLRDSHQLAGTFVKKQNLHVTLYPFFQDDVAPANLVEVASTLIQVIHARPFELVFDKVMSFRNGNCLVLASTRGFASMYGLKQQLAMRVRPRHSAGSLTPHMTLLYTRRFVKEQPIEPIRWTAREFVLVHSFVGQGRHDVVARWPLH